MKTTYSHSKNNLAFKLSVNNRVSISRKNHDRINYLLSVCILAHDLAKLIGIRTDYSTANSDYESLTVDLPKLSSLTNVNIKLLKGWEYFQSCVKGFNSLGLMAEQILPIYSNLMTIDENPDIKIGGLNADFNIRYDLKNYNTFKGNDIAMCVENSGAIAVGKQHIHLTSFKIKEKHLKLNGHSVMMGYLDAKLNTKVFKDNSLYVSI